MNICANHNGYTGDSNDCPTCNPGLPSHEVTCMIADLYERDGSTRIAAHLRSCADARRKLIRDMQSGEWMKHSVPAQIDALIEAVRSEQIGYIDQLRAFIDKFTPLAERLAAMQARAEAAEAAISRDHHASCICVFCVQHLLNQASVVAEDALIGSGTQPQPEHADGTRRSAAQASSSQPVDDLTDTGGSDQDNRPLADRWELKHETKEPHEP